MNAAIDVSGQAARAATAPSPHAKPGAFTQYTETIAGEPLSYPSSPNPIVSMNELAMAPGQVSEWMVHPVQSFLYVLEGELGLQHGEHQSTLSPGDAVYFDSSTAHSYFCAGPKPASALIVTMHQPPAPSVAPPRHVPGAPMARPLTITTIPPGEKR